MFQSQQKNKALTRIIKYLDAQKSRVLVKTFSESHFKYCLLVWMFHSRQLNKRIYKLHEGALFKEFLQRDISCIIHENNIQQLAIVLFKETVVVV